MRDLKHDSAQKSYRIRCDGATSVRRTVGRIGRLPLIASISFATALTLGMGSGGSGLVIEAQDFGASGTSSSATYDVEGSLGVASAGTPTSATYSVSGGFVEAAAPSEPACAADLTGDGTIDGADLAILLGSWSGSGAGDFDLSGSVDGADLAVLLGAWGPC